MSETKATESVVAASAAPIESPPPAPVSQQVDACAEARQTLHRLAAELMRTHNRRMLIEFLQLRRALR